MIYSEKLKEIIRIKSASNISGYVVGSRSAHRN